MRSPRRGAVAALALAVAAGLGGLAACGSSDQSSASSVAAAPAVAGGAPQGEGAFASPAAGSAVDADTAKARQLSGAAAGAPAAGAPAAGSGAAAVPARLVRTAEVVVQVEHLDTSAARVRTIATSLGGTVANETTSFSGAPAAPKPAVTTDSATPPVVAQPGESVLVLRVPVAQLDAALAKVTDPSLGKELYRTSSAQDVTADLADLESRVKTQQASVDRVRQLLTKASSLQDVVLLEGELTRREADLEAFEARRASLADRADLSTLTVTLRTPEAVATTPADDTGFTAGLRKGRHALLATTTVLLTVLGALVPVAVVAAVVVVPLLWWRRRTRATRRTTPPAPPSTPAAPSAPPPGPATPAAPAAPDATAPPAP